MTRYLPSMRLRGVAVMAAVLLGALVPAGAPNQTTAATPTCRGLTATLVGTSGVDELVGTSRRDVIWAGPGADLIVGKGERDVICGGSGNDIIASGGGGDSVVGGSGDDIIFGQGGSDVLRGNDGLDILLGQAGNDRYEGGPGFDLAGFLTATGPVTADLTAATATGEGTDTFTSIAGLIGSGHSDKLYGSAGTNALIGAGGDDYLHGRAGSDIVLYAFAVSAVTVDLRDRYATGGDGSDTVVAIEHAVGSPYDDVLRGTSGGNYLDGDDGSDRINGRGGLDICLGETVTNCPDLTTTSEPPATASAVSGSPSLNSLSEDFHKAESLQTTTDALTVTPGSIGGDGQYGVYCPNTWNAAAGNMPEISGHGFWAFRVIGGLGPGPWQYGPLAYWDADGWRRYVGGAWQWFDGDQVIMHGGAQVTVEVYYYSYVYGQYYRLGDCWTQGYHLIPGVEMVYVGPRY